jgi:hypothetical protein
MGRSSASFVSGVEMELEGTLTVERSPTRRWVSVIAVIVPVVVFVGVAAWFIRAYVAPPMIAIPSPMVLAAVPPATPMPMPEPAPAASVHAPATAAVAVQNPPTMTEPAAPVAPPAETATAPPAIVPMIASLAAAPPALGLNGSLGSAPAAYADPTPDAASAAAAPALEASEPIAGPIPLPPSRHTNSPAASNPPVPALAQVASAVPLPRPRPPEASPARPFEPLAFDRHTVQ